MEASHWLGYYSAWFTGLSLADKNLFFLLVSKVGNTFLWEMSAYCLFLFGVMGGCMMCRESSLFRPIPTLILAEVSLINSTLSSRTFCDEGSVIYLHCSVGYVWLTNA